MISCLRVARGTSACHAGWKELHGKRRASCGNLRRSRFSGVFKGEGKSTQVSGTWHGGRAATVRVIEGWARAAAEEKAYRDAEKNAREAIGKIPCLGACAGGATCTRAPNTPIGDVVPGSTSCKAGFHVVWLFIWVTCTAQATAVGSLRCECPASSTTGATTGSARGHDG